MRLINMEYILGCLYVCIIGDSEEEKVNWNIKNRDILEENFSDIKQLFYFFTQKCLWNE